MDLFLCSNPDKCLVYPQPPLWTTDHHSVFNYKKLTGMGFLIIFQDVPWLDIWKYNASYATKEILFGIDWIGLDGILIINTK